MLAITDLFREHSKKKGYKPRIGISIDGISKHFSAYGEFASDTTLFEGITLNQPKVRQSCDRLGGLAKVTGINLSILNLELFSNIFNSSPNVEEEDVEAFLYFDVSEVARRSLLLTSASSQYLNIANDAQLQPALPISVEMWVMFTDAAIGNSRRLFASDDQSDYSGIFIDKAAADTISINFGDNTGGATNAERRNKTGATALVANRWYHILAVITGAVDMDIYINGADDGGAFAGTGGGIAYSGADSVIGKRAAVHSDMYVAQVGFWDAALSAADALALYGNGTPKDLELAASYDTDRTGDLQGYWNPENMTNQRGDDVQVPDKTGNSQPAVLTNSPLWSWIIPCCLDADRLQFFKGKVKDFPTTDLEKVGFGVESLNPYNETTIGQLVSDSDVIAGSELPEVSRGKMKPIIYGDHTTQLGQTGGSTTTADRRNNFVPAVYLGLDDAGKQRWFIADHVVNSIAATEIWAWESRVQRFVMLFDAFTVEQNTAAGCIISIPQKSNFADIIYPDNTVSGEANVGGGDWTNDTNAANSDVSDFAESQHEFDEPATDQSVIDIDFHPYVDIPDAEIATVSTYVKFHFTRGAGLAAAQMHLKVNTAEMDGNAPDTIWALKATDEFGAGQAEAGASITIDHGRTITGANTDTTARIYQIWKWVVYVPAGEILPIYFAGKGMEYGTWVNDREAGVDSDPNGDLYTETHADHDGAGNLIENAAGVVESLQVDWLNLANTDIHEDSFNISSNDLSTSKFSFSIMRQIRNSNMLFDAILKSAKSVMFPDGNNQNKIRTFVSGDPFDASGDSVPNNEDIFEFDPQSFGKIDSGNNKLYIDAATITLTAANYTGTTLAAHIQTKLDDTFGGGQITFAYSEITGKFTFTEVAGGPYELEWTNAGGANVGRFLGFDISADDTLVTTKTSDYPMWDDSYVENPMVKSPLPRNRKSKQNIKTIVNVNYFLNSMGDYQSGVTDTDNNFHAGALEGTFNHDFTRDQTTVEILLDFLSNSGDNSGRLSKKYRELIFESWLNAAPFELWSFVNCREPVMNGILGSAAALTQKWYILEMEPGYKDVRVGITAAEV